MMTLAGALVAVRGQQRTDYVGMRKYITQEFPQTVAALRLIDAGSERRKPKGYNLIKRENKKLGFVYYVRYWHEGRMLPSKWCTHTNKVEEAERIAAERREEIIREYTERHDGRMYEILNNFYAIDSEYIKKDIKRNYGLSEKGRAGYHYVIVNRFIPFLRKRQIGAFERIDAGVIAAFQDELLETVKTQTVNNYMKAVRRIFRYLIRVGTIKSNPCKEISGIAVKKEDWVARGCLDIDRLKGVFDRQWENEKSRLLCMIIYSTGMRNSEINRINMDDIKMIEGKRFIQINKSKTENGERIIPLHEYVYKAITTYASKNETTGAIFARTPALQYSAANEELGRVLGLTEAEKAGITFYSGRHFWKTAMNANGLGMDIEEIFMAHKVSADVAKLYNHRDKQGQKRLAKEARRVYRILDKTLF